MQSRKRKEHITYIKKQSSSKDRGQGLVSFVLTGWLHLSIQLSQEAAMDTVPPPCAPVITLGCIHRLQSHKDLGTTRGVLEHYEAGLLFTFTAYNRTFCVATLFINTQAHWSLFVHIYTAPHPLSLLEDKGCTFFLSLSLPSDSFLLAIQTILLSNHFLLGLLT